MAPKKPKNKGKKDLEIKKKKHYIQVQSMKKA